MAITTNVLATRNAVKLDDVTVSFISSFPGKLNHFLARRLPQSMTRRVQMSCCYRETSLKAVTLFEMPETETSSVSDGVGILRFLKGKNYLVTGANGFLGKGKTKPKTGFSCCPSKLIFGLMFLFLFFVAVLIEKLLRASPEIGKIFLLIKSEDQESANRRLYDEVLFSIPSLRFTQLFFFFQISNFVSMCSHADHNLRSLQAFEENSRELLRSLYEKQVDSSNWRHWRRQSRDGICNSSQD